MTIRVFVGTSPNGEDAEASAVLEYTLREFSSEPIEITWMKISSDKRDYFGGWNTKQFSTPFTAFRWAIPEICGFQGKAIYMDTDVFVVSDIADLWNQPMSGNAMLVGNKQATPYRTCVSLLDCAALKPVLHPIDSLKKNITTHSDMLYRLTAVNVGEFIGKWNCVDLKDSGIDDPDLRAVHYSSIAHQLHLKYAIPRLRKAGFNHWYDGEVFPHWRPELIELFDDLLIAAENSGYLVDNYIPDTPRIGLEMRSYKHVRVKGFSRA